VKDLHRTLTVIDYGVALIGLLSSFGLAIRPHFCIHFVLHPIVLLCCLLFCSFCSINRVLALGSELHVDFLVVSAIVIIIFEFFACMLGPVGPLHRFKYLHLQ